MNWIKACITRQLVVMIGGTLIIVMALISAFNVINTKNAAIESINEQVNQLITVNNQKVVGFFKAKGEIVETFTNSPFVKRFMSEHEIRGADLSNNQDYQDLNKYFNNIKNNDSTIKSVFLGTAKSKEYMDEEGVMPPSYTVIGKKWWKAVNEQDRLFVNSPIKLNIADTDPTMVSTVMKTVYDDNNQFLGGAGVDILVDTIGQDLLSNVKFKGVGQAFLVSDNGSLVYYPKFTKDFPAGSNISQIDSYFTDSKGFTELTVKFNKHNYGQSLVKYDGVEHQVYWQQVINESPYINWKIAFMLPTNIQGGIVQDAVFNTLITSLLLIFIICIVVTLIASQFTKQINTLVTAMEDIAEGEGDLRARIAVTRTDELGDLGLSFNRFADKVHKLVLESTNLTESVSLKSNQAVEVCHTTRNFMSQQKSEIETASAATTEMAQTSSEMASSSEQVAAHADKANDQMIQARTGVQQAKQNMTELGTQINDTSCVVAELKQNTDQIGGVLEVIRTIAEQTNLLALNAAIEAARAGEQGRGFAVVADEVRNLASKTQDSTANIQQIIEKLQSSSVAAEQAMTTSVQRVEENKQSSDVLVDTLTHATDSVSLIQQQVVEISEAVSQQAIAAEEIASTVTKVRDLSDEAVQCGNELEQSLDIMSSGSDELSNSLNRFKV
ncbi:MULTISPECIES: methyl-accepting chemotaxis protein [unclassified Pseudoalteromonas]|uniref:methyl-accepting chemotaxis protein n=1 Tax=unclassified Pseudoalteromonas TaxID=194690 RepID=UPI0005A66084|nr:MULTISPECIES: methyl-accepting chemotaxis protein [unclassified Pseudoalteromonas]